MSKILTSCIKHNTLEINQYGGRLGRTTTDALHTLTTFLKNAVRRGEVEIGPFLDIKVAFC